MPARAKRNLSDDYGVEATHLDIMREALEQAQIRIEEKRMEANRPLDLNVRGLNQYYTDLIHIRNPSCVFIISYYNICVHYFLFQICLHCHIM